MCPCSPGACLLQTQRTIVPTAAVKSPCGVAQGPKHVAEFPRPRRHDRGLRRLLSGHQPWPSCRVGHDAHRHRTHWDIHRLPSPTHSYRRGHRPVRATTTTHASNSKPSVASSMKTLAPPLNSRPNSKESWHCSKPPVDILSPACRGAVTVAPGALKVARAIWTGRHAGQIVRGVRPRATWPTSGG
jgi:hypothetical protein